MTHESTMRPSITIDVKRNRIRIHRKTLHFLGNPHYILLLVNPVDRAFAIVRGECSDLRTHCLLRIWREKKQFFELWSRPLVRSLFGLSDHWQDNAAYRLYGENVPDASMVRFNIAESIVARRRQRGDCEEP